MMILIVLDCKVLSTDPLPPSPAIFVGTTDYNPSTTLYRRTTMATIAASVLVLKYRCSVASVRLSSVFNEP